MTRSVLAVLTCALLIGAGGCGSGGGGGGGPNPNDKRAVALDCIRDGGLDARPVGEKSIQVDGRRGPRVEFLVSSGEAEGRQFQGEAQDAEQIGAALLFINEGSEQDLKKIETCLENQ